MDPVLLQQQGDAGATEEACMRGDDAADAPRNGYAHSSGEQDVVDAEHPYSVGSDADVDGNRGSDSGSVDVSRHEDDEDDEGERDPEEHAQRPGALCVAPMNPEMHGPSGWYVFDCEQSDYLVVHLQSPCLLLALKDLAVTVDGNAPVRPPWALLVLRVSPLPKQHPPQHADGFLPCAMTEAPWCATCRGMGDVHGACAGCGTRLVAVECAPFVPEADVEAAAAASADKRGATAARFTTFSQTAPLCTSALGRRAMVVIPLRPTDPAAAAAAASAPAPTARAVTDAMVERVRLHAVGGYAGPAAQRVGAPLPWAATCFAVAGTTGLLRQAIEAPWHVDVEPPVSCSDALRYHTQHGAAAAAAIPPECGATAPAVGPPPAPPPPRAAAPRPPPHDLLHALRRADETLRELFAARAPAGGPHARAHAWLHGRDL